MEKITKEYIKNYENNEHFKNSKKVKYKLSIYNKLEADNVDQYMTFY